MIIAFDPGKNIGVAVVTEQGSLEQRHIISLEQLRDYPLARQSVLVVGDGTGSSALQSVLHERGLTFTVIDETGTTLEARPLYFSDHPPKGLARLLPRGLLAPPDCIDDYAAYAIALRYLQQKAPNP